MRCLLRCSCVGLPWLRRAQFLSLGCNVSWSNPFVVMEVESSMKDFAEIINQPYAGQQKSQQEIRETTKGKVARPADYQYGTKLKEWEPAETSLSRDEFIRQVEPLGDRIVVQLLSTTREGSIVLTDPEPLIGGCRKAIVLKTGPGKRIPGEWWKVQTPQPHWEWIDGYRQPVSVQPNDVVLIGNWVDLELEDIALCSEMDVRTKWGT